ncbi:MAG TPA: ABC transporter substrate-binding protein [Candidatus Acidoferrum sp.]|nr:ABC transporter substrate-binding protein [Candidatus Acidoferrum sp.]
MEGSRHTRPTRFGLSRRDLLKGGAAATLLTPAPLLAAEDSPKRGGILRVRGWDPPHFDPHQTRAFMTMTTLSFVYSKLLRHKVGAGVAPGTFALESDLAERWEQPDDTTYLFHLRKGVRWHNKPPVNGRELTADDVKFTFTRFLTIKGNPERYLLDSVERVEALDRYTVKFVLSEPYVWLPNKLANALCMWIVAPEVVEKYGDLKKAETAIGTGPFTLERYEPNVKAVFKRHPNYFRPGQPFVDGVEWMMVEDDSTGLAMYRTGDLDAGPSTWWSVRQHDVDALRKSFPRFGYQEVLGNQVIAISLRTDQPPFTDVRVRRAVSRAIDRRAIIDAVWMKGEPSGPLPRGVREWSLPVDQLGEGAKYFRYDPKEARRLLAEAGYPNGFKTQLTATAGYGADLVDAVQLVLRYLKDVGIRAELKLQEYGAYQATTIQGKFDGMTIGPFAVAWDPDDALYGPYAPEQPRNRGHITDAKLTAMIREQRRLRDLDARKKVIFDIQRYIADQQYYVCLASPMFTGSWQPHVKNLAANVTYDYGSRVAALWLDR